MTPGGLIPSPADLTTLSMKQSGDGFSGKSNFLRRNLTPLGKRTVIYPVMVTRHTGRGIYEEELWILSPSYCLRLLFAAGMAAVPRHRPVPLRRQKLAPRALPKGSARGSSVPGGRPPILAAISTDSNLQFMSF